MSDDLILKSEPISIPRAPGYAPMKPKSRRRVNTAEKRVQHNAIERQRRETLNGKFLNLARLLPSLANLRRPSKSAIVNGSIDHLNYQRQQRVNAAQELRRLVKERDELFAEVNEWRAISGQPIRKGEKSGWTEVMEEVAAVDNETFGTFTSVGGEQGGDDNDNEDEQDNAQVPSHGLITPRTSTDGELATSLSTSPFAAQPSIHSSAPEFANFTFGPAQPAATNMPLKNIFLSDPYDQQSNQSDSPLGSASHAHGVPTPPTTAHDQYTPSPSASAEDARVQQWTAQQLLYQLQRQQQQQQQQQPAYFGGYPSALPSQYQNVIYPPPVNTNGGVDAFTSTLMQSVFPQGQGLEMSAQQVDQWRRIAMGGMMQQQQPNPSMHDLRQAVRAGMGIGFGLSSASPTSGPGSIPAPWGQEPVKGF